MDLRFETQATSGAATGASDGRATRQRLRWSAVLAATAAVGLLVSFDAVVRQGVKQGAMRRAADVVRADAVWRCNSLRHGQARADCRLPAL